jgi:hypothetical protein
MASRQLNSDRKSFAFGLVDITATVTFAGTTVDPVLTYKRGIASMVRTADGVFTLTLSDRYVRLVDWSLKMTKATTPPVGFLPWTIEPPLVSTTGVIIFNNWKLDASATPAAVAAIPAAGEVGLLHLLLSTSSLTPA